MKIDTNLLKKWIKKNININEFINKLSFVGFETFLENNKLNISIPYNRNNSSNLFSIINEVSGLINISYFKKKEKLLTKNIDNSISCIKIDETFCYYYAAIIIKNINNNKDTPNNIKDILIDNKIRINNPIVDILNYIFIITGQPVHAYDLDKIDNNIEITKINKNTNIKTINYENIFIKKDSFVIKDNSKIISIPGIIGSYDSKIDKNTKNILIEVALFDKNKIKELNNIYKIDSLSSKYFENGININYLNKTVNLIKILFKKIMNSSIYKELEIKSKNINNLNKNINIKKKYITKLLGFYVRNKVIEKAIQKRFFNFKRKYKSWDIEIPYHRSDIENENNIISEILKCIGYENIPEKQIKSYNEIYNKRNINEYIRNYLTNNGFYEVINYSLVNESFEKNFMNEKYIKIKNPISENMSIMRTSLIQGLLKNASINLNRQKNNIKIFEIGNVWKGINNKSKLNIAIICTELLNIKNHYNNNEETFYILKKIAENIINLYNKKKYIKFKEKKYKYLNENISASILLGNKNIGSIGLLSNKINKLFNFKKKLFFLEIKIKNIKNKNTYFKELSKFPKIEKDISFILNKNIKYENLINFLLKIKIKNLKKIKFVNLYENNNLEKTITLKFIFQSNIETLKDKYVNKKIQKIQKLSIKNFNIKIKGL